MKIREVLRLTKEKRISEIAKESLSIGEKPARDALKNAGCSYFSGKRGWVFNGDDDDPILDKEIYEFTTIKPKANGKTKIDRKEKTNKDTNKKTEEPTNERKRASFDLDAELLKQLKIKAVVEDKNIYELVEQAIKEFLGKGE